MVIFLLLLVLLLEVVDGMLQLLFCWACIFLALLKLELYQLHDIFWWVLLIPFPFLDYWNNFLLDFWSASQSQLSIFPTFPFLSSLLYHLTIMLALGHSIALKYYEQVFLVLWLVKAVSKLDLKQAIWQHTTNNSVLNILLRVLSAI